MEKQLAQSLRSLDLLLHMEAGYPFLQQLPCAASLFPQQSDGDGEVVLESVDDLLTLDPIEVIRKSYQNKFRCEMRDELVELARRAVEAARREGGNE